MTNLPTIPNATITSAQTDSGTLYYIVTANSGYVLYNISEYNLYIELLNDGTLEGDIFDYLRFCRVMRIPDGNSLSDIGTMVETPEMTVDGIVNPNPPVTE